MSVYGSEDISGVGGRPFLLQDWVGVGVDVGNLL